MVTLSKLNKKELVGLLVKLGHAEILIKHHSNEWLIVELKRLMAKKNLTNKDVSEML